MNIDYIREFAVLADTLNYLEAADQLYISQSTLSKHIQTLEHELGTPLFRRTTRRVELNEFGQLFLPYARQIRSLQQEYTSAIQDALGQSARNLKLGSLPIMKQYRITELLAYFRKDHPEVSLEITEGDSDDLIPLIRQGKCELAFMRSSDTYIPLPEDLARIPYTRDELVAMVPVNHPLANRRKIRLAELAGEDFLMFQEHSQMNSFCLHACEASGFKPRVAFNGRRPENLADLAAHGLGVALLMKKQALYLNASNVRLLDLEPEFTNNIDLCYLKSRELTPAARKFVEYIGSSGIM